MKKGYFFDMDGTLYSNRFHSVPEHTIQVLNHLKEKGCFVGLATSRTKCELIHLPRSLREFGFDVKIMDGGACIFDKTGNVLKKDTMKIEDMNRLDAYCKEQGIVYRYSTLDGNYWAMKPTLYHHDAFCSLYLCAPVYKPYQQDEVLNVLVFVKTEKQRKEIGKLISQCGLVDYPDSVEIRTNQIDKASSIAWVRDYYHIDFLTCFGDGENDVDMIKMADVGIAMGNACSILKAVADVVTTNVEQDGIYNYFKEEM